MNEIKGVIWITGLSGAGKTTLASEVVRLLKSKYSNVIYLDGDELRKIFTPITDTPHSRESRLNYANQYSSLCNFLAEQGNIVVIATISLFKEIHLKNKKLIYNYFEVYLKVPIEILIERDSKKIYSSYFDGKLKNISGLDLEIDEPEESDIVLKNSYDNKISENAKNVVFKFIKKYAKS
tara:strand:- start:12 stop:551 length:540 start_codon:yes stop_codon:yes gene_type:complete